MQVYLNGSYMDSEEAKVSVNDRGFIFGDGVYEVIRCIEGEMFRAEEHLQRMNKGLAGLSIEYPPEDCRQLVEVGNELLERNNLTEGEATIYLQVTRGSANPRTHTFPDPKVSPTVYLSTKSFTPHATLQENGISVKVMSDIRWSRCDLKTLNLLPNTLAREKAKAEGYDSAILVRDGVITESPNANIFGVDKGVLRTFPECNYILSGITRAVVLEIAEELNISVSFDPIKQEELYRIDELFFCGTTTDIQPVIKADNRAVGKGSPGPVVQKIQKVFKKKLYAKQEA